MVALPITSSTHRCRAFDADYTPDMRGITMRLVSTRKEAATVAAATTSNQSSLITIDSTKVEVPAQVPLLMAPATLIMLPAPKPVLLLPAPKPAQGTITAGPRVEGADICPTCDGWGSLDNLSTRDYDDCPTCKGSGYVPGTLPDRLHWMRKAHEAAQPLPDIAF